MKMENENVFENTFEIGFWEKEGAEGLQLRLAEKIQAFKDLEEKYTNLERDHDNLKTSYQNSTSLMHVLNLEVDEQ